MHELGQQSLLGTANQVQILIGDIERAFPSINVFCVFVDNTSEFNRVLSALGTINEKHKTVIDPSKSEKIEKVSVALFIV